MDVWWGIWAVGLIVGVPWLLLCLTALRLRLWSSRLEAIPIEAIPPHEWSVLLPRARALADLGFALAGSHRTAGGEATRCGRERTALHFVSHRVHALLVVQTAPTGPHDAVLLLTSRLDGAPHTLTTWQARAFQIKRSGDETARSAAPDPADMLEDHLAAVAKLGRQTIDLEEAEAIQHFDQLTTFVPCADWVPDGHGLLRLTVRGAIRVATRLRTDQVWQRATAEYRQNIDRPGPVELEVEALARLEEVLERPLLVRHWAILFMVSAILTVAAFGVESIAYAAVLVGVLLLHEAGHAIAMWWCGYSDVRVHIVPFIGALATGTKASVSIHEEMLVLFAGPMPGLLIGLGLVPTLVGAGELHTWTVSMLIGLNALNLLPIFPADGGRIVHRLLAGLGTSTNEPTTLGALVMWIDPLFRLVGAITLAGLAFFGDVMLMGVALAVLVGLPGAVRVARSEARARALLPPSPTRDDARRAAFLSLEIPVWPQRLAAARELSRRIFAPAATPAARGLWACIYTGSIVAPTVAFAFVAYANRPVSNGAYVVRCGENGPLETIPPSSRITVVGNATLRDQLRTILEDRRALAEYCADGVGTQGDAVALATFSRLEHALREEAYDVERLAVRLRGETGLDDETTRAWLACTRGLCSDEQWTQLSQRLGGDCAFGAPLVEHWEALSTVTIVNVEPRTTALVCELGFDKISVYQPDVP